MSLGPDLPGVRRASVAIAILALLAVALSGVSPARAVANRTISGHVSDLENHPLGGITVRTTDDGTPNSSTTTAADGSYTLAVSPANNSYTVEFADPSGTYLTESYDSAYQADKARSVSVEDGDATGIDAQLLKRGSIVGVLPGPRFGDGTVVAERFSYGGGFETFKTTAAPDGTFRFPAVPPGIYWIFPDENTSDDVYLHSFPVRTGPTVSVKPGATVTAPPLLTLASQREVDIAPPTNSDIRAYPVSLDGTYGRDGQTNRIVDPTRFTQLPAGSYRFALAENAWLGGKSYDSATTYTPGRTPTKIHSVPAPVTRDDYGSVVDEAGHGVGGITVLLRTDDDNVETVGRTTTDAGGNWAVDGIGTPKGHYDVATYLDGSGRFAAGSGKAFSHLQVLKHLRAPIPQKIVSADTTVTVTVPNPETVDSVALCPADDEEGCVGTPSISTGTTTYTMPAGKYKVVVDQHTWVGGTNHANAMTFTLLPGVPNHVDIPAVPARGSLAGWVGNSRGNGVSGLTVIVSTASSQPQVVARVTTQDDGSWDAFGLPYGHYRVKVVDAEGRYASGVYGSGAGTAVVPQTGSTTFLDAMILPHRLRPVVAPRVTGTLLEGHTLTASLGKWSIGGATYSRRWYRNGKPISHATHAHYTLTTSDITKTISVKVTAKKHGYTSASAHSVVIKPVKGHTTLQVAAKSSASHAVTIHAHVKVQGVSRAYGTLNIYRGSALVRRYVTLSSKDSVTLTITGEPKGKHTYRVVYVGTIYAVPATKFVTVNVK